MKKYEEEELNYMANMIDKYLPKGNICQEMFSKTDCIKCANIDECYKEANANCNSEWAESINYDGCDSEKEFWEKLFS